MDREKNQFNDKNFRIYYSRYTDLQIGFPERQRGNKFTDQNLPIYFSKYTNLQIGFSKEQRGNLQKKGEENRAMKKI